MSSDIRKRLPIFLDDWIVPGIPIKRRLFYTYMRYRHAKEYLLSLIGFWNKTHDHIPHISKRQLIKYFSSKYDIRTFVETGTYLGDMVSTFSRDFEEIHSIELFRPLYEKACLRFATFGNVHLYFGDSSRELANILENLKHPALFWLDAHYSGLGTAKSHCDSPILDEINQIFDLGIINDVILIDDASLFNGNNGYPEINVLKKLIFEKNLGYCFSISKNIIILESTECA